MIKILEDLIDHIEECSMIRYARHAFNRMDNSS